MIPLFAIRLICGMSLTWCLMPRAEVTAGFFRIQMLVVLGLSVLATLTAGQLESAAAGAAWLSVSAVSRLCILVGFTAFVGSVLWTLARRRAGTAAVGATACAALLAVRGTLPTSAGPLAIGSELGAAWLTGGAMTTMLLGHWYLTAPTMSIAPLSRLSQYVLAAVVLRAVLAGAGLLTLGEWSLSQSQWTWLAMRWTAGIVGPAVMCGLVWRILRYRNTQSATGVLFAAVILTIIGETTASLLSRELHWPL
jgi:hypothetical protein